MNDFRAFLNEEGQYLSPKNGKVYKSLKAFTAHWFRTKSGSFSKVNASIKECCFCKESFTLPNLTRHEKSCYLNPYNIKCCINCGTEIRNFRTSKGTCSKSCANSVFKVGRDNGNYKGTTYRHICFDYHEKKCIICDETKIVAVHHYNEDHYDNRPENLIPLCPTHHQYMHSKYRGEIEDKVKEFIRKFNSV